jgi:CMP-N,N'-diacetyllegionaminic acid synthase
VTSANFYLGVVPARAGSKRIPGKNLVALGGICLIDYTLRAAAGAKLLGAVVLSTDSEQIAARAERFGALVPAMRPTEIAGDRSPIVDALRHALETFERIGRRVDAVVLLQPTSPFRSSTDIDRAIGLFERSGADTVTSVREARDHPHWTWRPVGDEIEPFFSLAEMATDRKDLPLAYAENGAVYVTRRELVAAGCVYGSRVIPYLMSEVGSIDIDTPNDLAWAEFTLARGLAGVEE